MNCFFTVCGVLQKAGFAAPVERGVIYRLTRMQAEA